MTEQAFSLLGIFPVSFILFSLSERVIARHEARVGKQIEFGGFIAQTWVDTVRDLRSLSPRYLWVLYLLQISVVFVFNLDLEFLLFPYFALNAVVLAIAEGSGGGVLERIDADRRQVAWAAASGIALLCSIAAFTLSHTTNPVAMEWTPGHLLFVVPFQLAGMILFNEHPFSAFKERSSWIQSVRFYAWSMLTAKLFLGGGSYFFDLQLKAGALYLFSRVAASYFPRYRQTDLFRLAVLYFFPITGFLWLGVMLLVAAFAGGVHV